MPYMIKCWIPIDEENPEIYKTGIDAEEELEHLQEMQPKNRYELEYVEPDDH